MLSRKQLKQIIKVVFMKKISSVAVILVALVFLCKSTNAQQLKIGVFDLDIMVQAMPGYHAVDSLVQVYERDTLGEEYNYYQTEYARLDSTYKADSSLLSTGKRTKAQLDFVASDRQKMAMNLVYWQQIAQNKSNNKRAQLAQPIYDLVIKAYKKVIERKKYTLILKPNTYELGFALDNIFISVARELKLNELPQQLLNLGNDPDAVKPPTTKQPQTGVKKNSP